MIISGNNGINSASKVYGVGQAKLGKSLREDGKTVSRTGDEVVLSSEAQALQQKIAAIKALPDVRADKVIELSRKVESGQYELDAAQIADQMIGRILADKMK